MPVLTRPSARRTLAAAALLLAASAAPAPAAAQGAQPAELRITAALVLPDLTVRPLPLLQLELVPQADTTRRAAFRTGLDGTAAQPAAAGRHRLRSVAPVTLGDSTYSWDVVVDVPAAGARVELTNANAVARRAAGAANAAAAGAGRQVAPERDVYERVRRGVLRVEAGLGHGSGFLADAHGGVVVTNDHVIGTATDVSVYIDSATRVPAQVVVRDRDADLAVLRLPAGRCADCPRLPLAAPRPGEPLVVAGERLLAIGFPLTQEMTLTSGIASSVREGAIISDVNLNPGNSGGPLLTLGGEVVGVNTFGQSAGVGAGVSGSIAITRLRPLLDRVPAALAALPPLADRALPVMPRATYPMALLKTFADTASMKAYYLLTNRSTLSGKFTVSLSTPTLQMMLRKQYEDAIAKDRRKREAQAGIAADQRYSLIKEARDWEQYVGSETAPVVAVQVVPTAGETTGSSLLGALAAGAGVVGLQSKYKFKGDVRGVRLYRNGDEVAPLRGGHAPAEVLIENQWISLKDVADMGYYVYPPEAFAPDSDATPPRVTVVIQDLKNPGSLARLEFWGQQSARVWNDFLPYFAATRSGAVPPAADPKKKSPSVHLDCEDETGACTAKR